MDFWDGTVGDGFSEGRWNGKAIPIMNQLVQMMDDLPSSIRRFYSYFSASTGFVCAAFHAW